MLSLFSSHHVAFSTLARRTRFLAGLQPWVDARPQYRLRLGPAALPFDALTDEALVALRFRIADAARRERAERMRAAV